MNITFNNSWATWVVLATILNMAAIFVSVLKQGKNAQTIRAIAVVGTFIGSVWLGLVSLVWAGLDFLIPSGAIKIPKTPKKGK